MKNTFGCVNNTIKVFSGKYFDLADPRPEQFDFADIASALAKICRFGGQCPKFYSVAEHSIRCAQQALDDGQPIEVQAAVLLHDAAEAFVGDVVKPLKNMLSEYKAIESAVERAIGVKFGIDFDKHADAISEIDHAMLIAERKLLFGADGVYWSGEDQCRVLTPRIAAWLPREAESQFLHAGWMIGAVER